MTPCAPRPLKVLLQKPPMCVPRAAAVICLSPAALLQFRTHCPVRIPKKNEYDYGIN